MRLWPQGNPVVLGLSPPAPNLAALSWYQFPSTTAGGRGGSNSRCSSHKEETKGTASSQRDVPPCWTLCAPWLTSWGWGEDIGFPHCCNFPLALKQLERRHSAAWGGRCASAPGAQLCHSTELLERVLKLTSNPLPGEIQM